MNIAVNTGSVRQSITQWVEEKADIQIGEYASVFISPIANLSLNHLSVRSIRKNTDLAFECERFTLTGLLSKRTRAVVRGLETPLGRLRYAAFAVSGSFSYPQIDAEVDGLTVDVEKLSAFQFAAAEPSTQPEPQTELTLPFHLQSVTLDDLVLQIPRSKHRYRVSGEFRQPDQTGVALANLFIHSQQQPDAGDIEMNVQWSAFPAGIASVTAQFNDLPVQSVDAFPAELALGGSASVVRVGESGYEIALSPVLHSGKINAASMEFRWERISPSIRLAWNAGTGLQPVEGIVPYENFKCVQPNFSIPNGRFNLFFSPTPPQDSPNRLEWTVDSLGSVSLSAAKTPTSATENITLNVNADFQPQQPLDAYLPETLRSQVADLNARVTLSGDVQVQDLALTKYQFKFTVQDDLIQHTSADINGLLVEGSLNGNAQSHEAVFSIQSKIGVKAGGDLVIPFEPEAVPVQAKYDAPGGKISMKAGPFDSNWFDEITAAYESGKPAVASFSLDLEDALPLAMQHFIPNVTRAFDGLGTVLAEVSVDDKKAALTMVTDDVLVSSFDEEPYYGVQLRDLSIEAAYPMQGKEKVAATVAFASPYLLYGDYEIDLPGDTFSVEASTPDTQLKQYDFALQLPGGGGIDGTLSEQNQVVVGLHQINLPGFLIPLAQKTLKIAHSGIWDVSGEVNGSVSYDLTGGSAAGAVSLDHLAWRYDGEPGLFIEEGSITLPVSYPFDKQNLSQRDITFAAGNLLWQDDLYENVRHTMPFDAQSVRLLETLDLPLFGGALRVKDLALDEWRGAGPAVTGAVILDKANMAEISRAYPSAPSAGVLDASVSTVRYDDGRIAIDGGMDWSVFNGHIRVNNLFYRTDDSVVGLDMEIDRLNMEALSAYFNYGKITGVLEGSIRNLELQLPASPNEYTKPKRFDLNIRSIGSKDGIVSGLTLKKLMELGQTSVPLQESLYSREFKYAGLGLRGIMDGDRTELYGTRKGNFFIEHSDSFFANKVGIRLGLTEQKIDFERVWQTLLAQVGKD